MDNMPYYFKFSLFLCCLIFSTPFLSLGQSEKDGPNIIIVYCDDLGYGDIGINGHPEIRTPFIDRMAMEGIRFSNYYSASPACTASRYSLLTGRYPVRSGFRWVLNPDAERGIHPREETLAEVLRQVGYHSAIFGKWHLGSTKKAFLPLQNGFDEYVGLPYSNDMIPPDYPSIALLKGNDTLEMNPDQRKLTEFYTDCAIDFIKRNKKNKFFLYLPYAMPHVPLYPGERFIGTSARGAFGDAVQEIDYYVGQLLQSLRDEDLDKNTIVWFLSDNGPWLLKNQEGGSAGLFKDGKGSTWEGGVRVPCVVWWPGTIPNGTVNTRLLNAMDVYATSISLAGARVPSDRQVDGKILYSFVDSVSYHEDRPFFYYGVDHKLMAVRLGKWKLHVETYSQLGRNYFDDQLPLLFNLEEDPSENYNLAAQYPEIVLKLNELVSGQNERVKTDKSFWDQNL